MHAPTPKPSFILTFFFLFSLHLSSTVLGCHQEDHKALQNIMTHFGSYEGFFYNWYSLIDCCNWQGVGCNTEGRVTSLNLNMNLVLTIGTEFEIPSFIQDLTFLESLKIYVGGMAKLVGPIPQAIAHLHHLRHLDFNGNQLTGPIPDFICQLEKLKFLDVTGNQLSGKIEAVGFLTELKTLKLGNNQLTGPVPWNFGLHGSLEYLDLSSNHLNETIPGTLARLNKLAYLDLSHNRLGGSIPEGMGQLPLGFFDVSDNQLVGKIPQGLSQFNPKRFDNNKGLCGRPLPPCEDLDVVRGETKIIKQMISMIE